MCAWALSCTKNSPSNNNVVTLVSPVILTLVVMDISLIRPILTDWQSPSVTNRLVIVCKGILLQLLLFCVASDAYSHTVGFSIATLYIFLWTPYGIGQAIIFSYCAFFLSICFFSSPNLSGRKLDVYHTSTHGVA